MVDVQQQGEFSVVKMSRPPVNSFSLEFLEELNLVLEDLENDRSCRGIILASVRCVIVIYWPIKGTLISQFSFVDQAPSVGTVGMVAQIMCMQFQPMKNKIKLTQTLNQ